MRLPRALDATPAYSAVALSAARTAFGGSGLLLLSVTVLFFFALINVLVSDQQLLFQAMLTGLMLAFLWYLYMHLPAFLRRFVSRLVHRSNKDDPHGH